ncbi:MAG: hypothetical protein Q7V40_21255, partial [Pseudolabrys sp.]|nr:hypothetical protein [Pseudolabrys sp.]
MGNEAVLQLWALFLILVAAFVAAKAVAKWIRRRDISHARISEATIARDLIPKLSKVANHGSTYFITGGDGYALLKYGIYPWRRFLKKVIREGANIKYLLTNVRDGDDVKLALLKEKIEKVGPGKIDFC